MKKKINTGRQGFTLVELLVVISIIGLLASLAFPALTAAITKSQLTQALSNAKQLQLAAMQAGLDATVSGNYGVAAWPGDMTTVPATSSAYWAALGLGGYLTDPKICVATGIGPAAVDTTAAEGPLGKVAATTNAYSACKAQSVSDDTMCFVWTKNFTPPTPLNAISPFALKGFVVVRKAGDGGIYKVTDAASEATGYSSPQWIYGEDPTSLTPPVAVLTP